MKWKYDYECLVGNKLVCNNEEGNPESYLLSPFYLWQSKHSSQGRCQCKTIHCLKCGLADILDLKHQTINEATFNGRRVETNITFHIFAGCRNLEYNCIWKMYWLNNSWKREIQNYVVLRYVHPNKYFFLEKHFKEIIKTYEKHLRGSNSIPVFNFYNLDIRKV